MKPIRSIRRLAAALAGLVCAWLGLAIGVPAAFAAVRVPPPGSGPPGISVLLDRARTRRKSATAAA